MKKKKLMKELPQTFRRDKYDFVQVASYPGQVFIYEQRRPLPGLIQTTGLKTKAYQICAWEVVVARWQKERKTSVAHWPEGWTYPTSRQWGSYGFTLMTLDKAQEKAKALSKKYQGRKDGPQATRPVGDQPERAQS